MVLIEREDGNGMTCSALYYICDNEEGKDVPECEEYREEKNSDATTDNDISPTGVGYFCDHPSNPSSCYDRNDDPEEYCVNYQDDEVICTRFRV